MARRFFICLRRTGFTAEFRPARNAIRLLLLTGSRQGEVLTARWEDFDLDRGVWTKPSHHTKQKRIEHVPLSAPALQLLISMKREASDAFLFPGNVADAPLKEIGKSWAAICKTAGIDNTRLHDLRHTYASHLVSSGMSLPIVGRFLGPRSDERGNAGGLRARG